MANAVSHRCCMATPQESSPLLLLLLLLLPRALISCSGKSWNAGDVSNVARWLTAADA